MLDAHADLTIEGPGIRVRVHGTGRRLVADVAGIGRDSVRLMRSLPEAIRLARGVSRVLRAGGFQIAVRVGGRTVAQLGARERA